MALDMKTKFCLKWNMSKYNRQNHSPIRYKSKEEEGLGNFETDLGYYGDQMLDDRSGSCSVLLSRNEQISLAHDSHAQDVGPTRIWALRKPQWLSQLIV